jgi:hypothetical protein
MEKITPQCKKAIFLVKNQLSKFVFHDVQLAGINYTSSSAQPITDFMLSCLDPQITTIMSEPK